MANFFSGNVGQGVLILGQRRKIFLFDLPSALIEEVGF
jgi:hypothetical protein